jgi:copper homeostasis protein
MDFRIEICVDTVQSALIAQGAGADRVELCDNLSEGGTTPGYGTILAARENLDIGLNVLIRPRAGDFLYSELEFGIIKKDIEACRQIGVDGIVIGLLLADGRIDVAGTAELVRFAHPMQVTFHRAFDMCCDPVQGLEDVIATGAARLLTSGQGNTAEEGMELISKMVRIAQNRIIIMPGSGINDTNIGHIASTCRAGEYHLSARRITDSMMTWRKQGVTMGGISGYNEFTRKIADGEKISRVISILRSLQVAE